MVLESPGPPPRRKPVPQYGSLRPIHHKPSTHSGGDGRPAAPLDQHSAAGEGPPTVNGNYPKVALQHNGPEHAPGQSLPQRSLQGSIARPEQTPGDPGSQVPLVTHPKTWDPFWI